MSWNCMGTNARGFSRLIKDIKGLYSISFLILLETQISGEKAEKVICKLGFDGVAKVDARGRSGGIWCLWDSNSWDVHVLEITNQALTLEVKGDDGTTWILSAVYGSPHYSLRGSLWTTIRDLAADMNKPWCIIGDFNVVASEAECMGSSSLLLPRGATEFAALICDCDLIDLGYIGSSGPNLRRRPFRMLAAWLSHPTFESQLQSHWDGHLPWNASISNLQEGLKIWNKDVEYEGVLHEEELLWFQKSRSKWLIYGDRNTRFFHASTVIRRRRQNISILQDEEGNWIHEREELEIMATTFFKKLYTEDGASTP
ncbi:PREDICTED: uncharacterized protein LOC109353844 [Lupinus angustifolius]|uniref:uncharacterized protein LOC109353844 n=1 Tax=Lupinus angustifolius TaxID=3871 RepID=UPI00092F6D69|nr:PREDICTED: uncharacterized protein LOC109353844 [Lupinus angustifolius]